MRPVDHPRTARPRPLRLAGQIGAWAGMGCFLFSGLEPAWLFLGALLGFTLGAVLLACKAFWDLF